MTIHDLITGAWSWDQLLRTFAPYIVLATGAFFAGYERGYHKGFMKGTGLAQRTAKLLAKQP